MTRTTHIVSRSIVAVAAAALLIAPAALAGGTSQYGPHDPWYAYATSLAPAQHDTASFTTDTLGGNGRPQQVPAVHFVSDTLAPGGGTTFVAASRTFDWSDAGVGAGVAIGALLLASLAAFALLRRRGRLAF